jgi:hypothetical protein
MENNGFSQENIKNTQEKIQNININEKEDKVRVRVGDKEQEGEVNRGDISISSQGENKNIESESKNKNKNKNKIKNKKYEYDKQTDKTYNTDKTYKQINPLKLIVDMNKGGYNSYLQNKAFLGDILEFLIDNLSEEIEVRFKKNVLDLLEDGKIYSVLLQISYINEGQVKGSSPMKSIIITKNIDVYNVIQRFKIAINNFIDEYELVDCSGKCFVC